MTNSRIVIVSAALLWLCFACEAEELSITTQEQVKLRLVFDRVEGGEYIFLLRNDSSRTISLLLDKSTALETAAECWSHDPILRAGTFFPIRDPDAPGHTLPNTNVPPGKHLELRYSSEILPRSARLPEKAKNAYCHIRIQLHHPNKILESNEFEP
jgi:hypothetical protein